MGRDRRRCAWLQPGTAARLKAGLPKAPMASCSRSWAPLPLQQTLMDSATTHEPTYLLLPLAPAGGMPALHQIFTGSPSVAAVAANGSSSPPSPRIAAPAPYRQRGAQFPPGGRKAPIPQPLPRSLPLSQSLLLPQQMHGDSQCFIPLHSLWKKD